MLKEIMKSTQKILNHSSKLRDILLVSGLFATGVAYSAPGDTVWEISTDNPQGTYTTPSLDREENIYIGLIDPDTTGDSSLNKSHLISLTPSGSVRWRKEFESATIFFPRISPQGKLYVNIDHSQYAFDTDGNVLWVSEGNGLTKYAIAPNGALYGKCQNHFLCALTPDGEIAWKYQNGVINTTSIDASGFIYVGVWDDLISFYPDGRIRWSVKGAGGRSSVSFDEDGTIYSSAGKSIYAINQNGSVKWSYDVGEAYAFTTPTIGTDGSLYAGLIGPNPNTELPDNQGLIALDSEGNEKWRFSAGAIGGDIYVAPIIGKDNALYFPASGDLSVRGLYSLTQQGSMMWSVDMIWSVDTSPALASSGTLYQVIDKTSLRAIETTSAGLAETSWPKDGGNNQNNYNLSVASGSSTTAYDQNNDGMADLIWRNLDTGDNWYHAMREQEVFLGQKINTITSPWEFKGRGDFNGDGMYDMIWRNTITGANYIYFMNSYAIIAEEVLNTVPTDLGWDISQIADFNGDGKDDVLWKNTQDGRIWMYLLNGAQITHSQLVTQVNDSRWNVIGSSDISGDGKADLLFRNIESGMVWMYFMDGPVITTSKELMRAGLDWQLVINGDFDGDGDSDLLWRNLNDGRNYVYLLDAGAVNWNSRGLISQFTDQSWQAMLAADFDGDGVDDIYWRNIQDGRNYIYFMDALTYTGKSVRSVDVDWQPIQ